ncbi:MAG: hypothetical protein ACOC7S_01325 [Planctomycetota bacterium]
MTADTRPKGKKFLGVMFECCHVYARLYRNTRGDAYEGRCPRCSRRVRVRIDPEGTDQRFFTAYPRRLPRRF